MIETLNIVFSFFLYSIIFISILFLIGLLFSKNYNIKYRNFYALLMDLSFREFILYASVILNFLLTFYFLFNISSFYVIGIYMFIVLIITTCFCAFNFFIAFINLLYGFISIELLWLFQMISNYLNYMRLDKNVLILERLLIIMIIIYTVFISVRKIELLLKNHRKIGGKV